MAKRIAITKTFDVECLECSRLIDSRPTWQLAAKAAAEHRRAVHPGEGLTIGGTWSLDR